MSTRVKKRIARFVDVRPLFVSLVGRPASRKFFTEVLRAADLEEHEAAGGTAVRSDDPEVAEFLVALRNDQAGERARKVTFTVVRTDKERHVVYGAAYCPALDVDDGGTVSQADFDAKVDTYGTFMDSDTLLDLAHAYMEESRAVDVDHSMKAVDAFPVESVFLREGEQTDDYPHPNTWKVGIKIRDKKAWKRVEKGEIKAFSIAVNASFEPIDVWVESDDEADASETDNTQTASAERGDGMSTIVTRTAVAFQDWPLADKDLEWDGAGAAKRCRELCSSDGSGDKDKMDWAEYARCFLWFDESAPEDFGSYKLGIVDVVDGDRKAIPRGIYAAAGRIDQTEISDEDKEKAREHLGKYYAKLEETPPWERSEGEATRAGEEPAAAEPEPQQGGSTDPVAEPAAVVAEPAATRAESKYMTHLTDMLAKSDASGRVWYALYALEDIVGACVYECAYDCCNGAPEHTEADVAQAFDDAKAFMMPALAELIALNHSEQRSDITAEEKVAAKRAAVEKVLAIRSEIAARKGRVLSQANYEKLSASHGLIRDVLDAAEAAESTTTEAATDNDGKPAGEGGMVMTTEGCGGDDDEVMRAANAALVARLDALQTRLDALEAVTRSVPTVERLDAVDVAVRSVTEQAVAVKQLADGLATRMEKAETAAAHIDADVASLMEDAGIQRSAEGRPAGSPTVKRREAPAEEARRSVASLMMGQGR